MSKDRTPPTYEQVTIADLADGQRFWTGTPPSRTGTVGSIVAASLFAVPDMATLVTDDSGMIYAYDPATPVWRVVAEG